jgi:alcohol dehydrogenase class IV
MTTGKFRLTTVPCFECGPGIVSQVGAHCDRLEISQLLIVTDPGLVQLGLVDPVMHALRRSGISFEVFAEVREDPPAATVLDAARQARDCGVDGVLGIGGGSSMDVAKLVAVLAGSDVALDDIYGVDQIHAPRLPLIQVPTTAGTGSEMTSVAIVTTGETTKAGVVSEVLLADVALLDAQLTLGMPPALTAMTGIDAMVHAIEAYTSKHKKNPYSDMLAREALRLMSANIATAVHHGDNAEARSAMLLGSMMAGQAFANAPVAAVHALAYPIGGHFHIAHGLSNSLVLPQVLRFNSPVAAPLYAQLALLVKPDLVVASDAGAIYFIEYLEQLICELALPNRLREVGIAEQDLDLLADEAMKQERLLVNNPRVLERADAFAIYQAAF